MVNRTNRQLSIAASQLAEKSYEVMTLILAKYSITDLPTWHDLDPAIKLSMILGHMQHASVYLSSLISADALSELRFLTPKSN